MTYSIREAVAGFRRAPLLTGLSAALAKMGFTVYSQKLVPANDGGLALGQAVAAAAKVAAGEL